MHQQVRARQRASESRAVFLEAGKVHLGRSAPLEAGAFRTIAEEDQDRRSTCTDLGKRFDHDVPTLLDCEPSDPDEQGGLPSSGEVASARLASRTGMKRPRIDPERYVLDPPDSRIP
jgi:hypothetical protein